jgi:hypothetical protein
VAQRDAKLSSSGSRYSSSGSIPPHLGEQSKANIHYPDWQISVGAAGVTQLDTGLGLVHPAMRVNIGEYGSVVVDVAGPRMDVHFVTADGVRDHFAVCKGGDDGR